MDASILDELILNGSIEVAGVLDDGNFTFRFTKKLKENNPEIYKQVVNFFYQQVAIFWEKGFLNFDFSEQDPFISVTEKVYDEEALNSLSAIEKINLDLIVSTFIKEDK